jgi:hypothetical protein
VDKFCDKKYISYIGLGFVEDIEVWARVCAFGVPRLHFWCNGGAHLQVLSAT